MLHSLVSCACLPLSLFPVSSCLLSVHLVPSCFSENISYWRTGVAGDEHGDVGKAAAEATKGEKSLQPIHLEVSRASAGAIEAIESQGGTVTCAHFNRLALRALVSFCRLRVWSAVVGVSGAAGIVVGGVKCFLLARVFVWSMLHQR